MTSIQSCAFCGCFGLTSITIPKRIESIGSKAFERCSRLTIYTEAEKKPTGWKEDWNISKRPVVWGCTLSENKDYVVSFTKTADNIENLTALRAPCREGYIFEGWFSFEDEQIYNAANIYSVQDGVTLFAVWEKINNHSDKVIDFCAYKNRMPLRIYRANMIKL